MPVEYTVDSLDTVDESIRGAYVPSEDGKFNFDPDKYAEVKAQGLKNKNSELIRTQKQIKEANKRFEPFAQFSDEDIQEILDWREQKLNPPPADPNKGKGSEELQAQFDKVLKSKETKWNSEKAALETQLAELTKENKHFKLTVPLRDIAAKAGVFNDYLDLALLDTAQRFALDDDGKIVVLDDGEPSDVTPEKFFSVLYKEQRPNLYAPSGAAGSGAPANTGINAGGRAMRMADFQKLSSEQQRAFMTDVKAGKAKLVD